MFYIRQALLQSARWRSTHAPSRQLCRTAHTSSVPPAAARSAFADWTGLWATLFACCVAFTAGPAFAQAAGPNGEFADETEDDRETSGPSGSAAESGELPVQRRAQLSAEQQRTRSEELVQQADTLSRRVLTMLDEARRERDIIRVTCLNDKLDQINALRQSLGDRVGQLRDALQARNTSAANHEYTVITVLGQRYTTLEQEANQCIGQDIFETGTVQIVADIAQAAQAAINDVSAVEAVPVSVTVVPSLPPPASL